LLADEAGRDILQRIYQSYAQVALRYGLPIQLGTPTWRPSRRWTKDVGSVNAAAVGLLRAVRHWRRCCTRTAQCPTGHHSQTRLPGSMPRSSHLRVTI
jgi:hypothetical protein